MYFGYLQPKSILTKTVQVSGEVLPYKEGDDLQSICTDQTQAG